MNDIFISYRRRGGEAWAAHLKELLEKAGVRCYLDKHKKRTIDFKEALFRNIDQSNNFLLLLTENVFESRLDEIDWVREEIDYARKQNKNIIAVQFNGYVNKGIDWKSDERISFLETFECLTFDDTNLNLRNASVKSIIQYMVDENGKPWTNSLKDNSSWYTNSTITDEDRVWMYTSMEVCKKMDSQALKLMMKSQVFENRDIISFFTLTAYDIDSLAKRTIEYNEKENPIGKKVNVYGFCHESDLDHANEVFGENHFVAFDTERNITGLIKNLLELNEIECFDIVDMTLILKDFQRPEEVMRNVTAFLNKNGSAIYIRDLDDDLVTAYPDENRLVERMIKLLSLDPGAGNRHFGKRIYTYLHRSGAEEIYMMDSSVSTANVKTSFQRKICDAYFSYLLPEFRYLVNCNPKNEDYIDSLNWLELHYPELKNLFESKEFYFRAGFISGFGIYKDDEYFDD